jgi:hypothetical protein
MRSGFTFILLLTVLFGSGYWYFTARAVCDVPIDYRIGVIDPRFDITREEVRAAVSTAESLWEDATGRNLFTFDEEAGLSLNFIFDERQAEADAELELREALEEREGLNERVKVEYRELLDQYQGLKNLYERRSAQYEERLKAHNAEVARWNDVGGAPQDIYENLSNRQKELAGEQKELNNVAYKLNQLVQQMNTIGAEGNAIISDYNEIIEEYNTLFEEAHEFTQGDYQRDVINIYQFDTAEELNIVLAHEFGHALNLGHVEGEQSIMYHFMGAQTLAKGVTDFDLSEFERVCGEGGLTGLTRMFPL